MLNKKIDKKVNEMNNTTFSCLIGYILSVNELSNTATIEIINENSSNNILKNIPLPRTGNGIKLASPKPNTKVLLGLTSKSILQAKIICIYDDTYKWKTRNELRHVSQGTYIHRLNLNDIKKSNEVYEKENPDAKNKASCLNWIDTYNTYSLKYLEFTKRAPINDLIGDISKEQIFQENEIGFYSDHSKSLIKIKQDGTIDIFTKDNVGVRVDTSNNSISLFGDNCDIKSDKMVLNIDDVIINSNNFTINSKNLSLLSDNLIMNEKE